MMRRMSSKFLALVVSLCLMGIMGTVSAYDGVPETIKIGLFYASRAKSACKITATGGMSLSVRDDSGGYDVTEDTSVSEVDVRKDDRYHAQLKENFDTYDVAWTRKEALRKEGYPAFAAYNNGSFKVWVGAYTKESEAQDTAAKLGAEVLGPSATAVLLWIGDNIWCGVEDGAKSLQIDPISGNLAVEGKAYRGAVRFLRQPGNDMAVINVVGFDDYLYGVVPREVTATWNIEAVKAQAVVSRTFAMTQLNKFSKYGFNLDDTTSSQVYAGISIEHPNSNKAVDETKGQIVTYNGKPAEVYFFGSSGGRTANAEDVWGGGEFPYLKSVEDPYENPDEATNARWTMTLSPQQVKEKLAAKGIDIGEITDITTETADSGRVLKTVFHGTNGEKVFHKEDVRWTMGFQSTYFTVSRAGGSNPEFTVMGADGTKKVVTLASSLPLLSASGKGFFPVPAAVQAAQEIRELNTSGGTGDFIINGRGWGHGVGMSQWGAKGMAENGFTYKQIIEHYFTGATVS